MLVLDPSFNDGPDGRIQLVGDVSPGPILQ